MIATAEFALARRVVVYAATADELPVDAVVAAAVASGKTLLWPRIGVSGAIEVAPARQCELVAGAAGVLAPPPGVCAAALHQDDLLVAPGIAFTRAGVRLGRGGGHYDRLLASVRVTSIGVAFDIQLADELPVEAHDRGVDLVVTPGGLWRRTQ